MARRRTSLGHPGTRNENSSLLRLIARGGFEGVLERLAVCEGVSLEAGVTLVAVLMALLEHAWPDATWSWPWRALPMAAAAPMRKILLTSNSSSSKFCIGVVWSDTFAGYGHKATSSARTPSRKWTLSFSRLRPCDVDALGEAEDGREKTSSPERCPALALYAPWKLTRRTR